MTTGELTVVIEDVVVQGALGGAYVIVDDIAARDAIVAPEEGQLVKVLSNGMVYRYDGAGWVVAFYGIDDSATRTLVVDPDAGDDEGIGSVGDPLLTIQHAVLRFKPPHLLQTWTRGDDRTIRVVYTLGMDDVDEQIDVPPHAGEGILLIKADEQTVHSGLIESGAIAAITGFEVRRRITLTTSPLSAAALADNAFVTPTNRDANAANEIDAALEDLPIVTNATGMIDVVAIDPGTLSAFQYANTTSLKVVRPQITWTLPAIAEDSPSGGGSQIKNHGSPLIVLGFNFTPQADPDGDLVRFPIENVCTVPAARLCRCTLASNTRAFTAPSAGDGVALTGVIIGADAVESLAKTQRAFSAINVRIAGSTGGVDILDSTAELVAVDAALSAPLTLDGSVCPALYADLRGSGLEVESGSAAVIAALTVQSAGGTAGLAVSDQATAVIANGSRVKGTTGNTGTGASVGTLSSLAIATGTPTISGTTGNLTVGELAVQTWAEGPTTDIGMLARFAP